MDDAKRTAGRAAAELVTDGMRLGLGTGSTVAHFLDALAEAGRHVAGVPTSEATARRCRELGIALLDIADVTELDLCVDGADELTTDLTLTKGGGGALLREKVVASLARRSVVIATEDKLVAHLGDTFALPLEVVPFAAASVRRAVLDLGFDEVTARGDGSYRTDNGNVILDARVTGGIDDPAVTDLQLLRLPGLAETGLFVELATDALLAAADGQVRHLQLSDH